MFKLDDYAKAKEFTPELLEFGNETIKSMVRRNNDYITFMEELREYDYHIAHHYELIHEEELMKLDDMLSKLKSQITFTNFFEFHKDVVFQIRRYDFQIEEDLIEALDECFWDTCSSVVGFFRHLIITEQYETAMWIEDVVDTIIEGKAFEELQTTIKIY